VDLGAALLFAQPRASPKAALRAGLRGGARAVDRARAAGLHWRESGRIIAADELQQTLVDPVAATLSFVCLRQVRVESAPGEMLFDTQGLAGLALPEVQMHFRGLTPELAAQCVLAVAGMTIDRGLFANDGDLIKEVPGVPDLRLRYELGIRLTDQVVLDLDPGAPYTAGKRS
jgi:hypothetical protein